MAKQYRTCPPPGVFKDRYQRSNAREHLAVCPHCASKEDGSAESLDMWERMAQKIEESLPAAEFKKKAAGTEIGQIRCVRAGLGGWHKGLYYNPPCVLVIDANTAYPDVVRVVQIYHDITLAAPGDLILSSEQTGCGECFAESWNVYTLKTTDLDYPVGCVSGEIVDGIRRMGEDFGFLPEWAIAPKPLIEHDPRTCFRELEVTVGYIFSSRAVAELLHTSEQQPLKLAYASTAELIADIRIKIPDVRWPADPPSIEIALAVAQLPTELSAKAADDEGGERVPVNLFAIRSGRLFHTTSAEGVINWSKGDAAGIKFSGRIKGLPEKIRGSGLWCYLYSEKTGYIQPESVDWDEKTGYFSVRFDTGESDAVNPYIGIIYDLDAP